MIRHPNQPNSTQRDKPLRYPRPSFHHEQDAAGAGVGAEGGGAAGSAAAGRGEGDGAAGSAHSYRRERERVRSIARIAPVTSISSMAIACVAPINAMTSISSIVVIFHVVWNVSLEVWKCIIAHVSIDCHGFSWIFMDFHLSSLDISENL